MPRVRKKRASRSISGQTLNSTNTGIPASEWYTPPTSTADEDLFETLEEVESYLWHVENDITPITPVRELLARVVDDLLSCRRLAERHQELTDEHDVLKERCSRTRIENVLKHAIHADHKLDTWAIADEVVNLLDKGIEPAEDATPDTQVTS